MQLNEFSVNAHGYNLKHVYLDNPRCMMNKTYTDINIKLKRHYFYTLSSQKYRLIELSIPPSPPPPNPFE